MWLQSPSSTVSTDGRVLSVNLARLYRSTVTLVKHVNQYSSSTMLFSCTIIFFPCEKKTRLRVNQCLRYLNNTYSSPIYNTNTCTQRQGFAPHSNRLCNIMKMDVECEMKTSATTFKDRDGRIIHPFASSFLS